MSKLINIQLTVNNETHQAAVPADMNLMHYLREYLGLTGTKNGCNSGHCGACTVILNGKVRRACLVRMSKVDGCNVETIEGLSSASNGDLHPLQYSYVEQGAVQCGFCTPGMIMTATDMVARYQAEGKTLTEENIRNELEGNICRCTGYHNIVKSIADGASKMTSA